MSKNKSQHKRRKIQKDSVLRALELLKSESIGYKNANSNKEPDKEKDHKIIQNCVISPFVQKRRQSIVTGFTKQLAITELRSYLKCHDWHSIQHLFLRLLNYDKSLEPLLWRSVLIIILYSPESNSNILQQFLQLCVGCRTDSSSILEKLLYLPEK